MPQDDSLKRRGFVKLAGAAAASVSLAGCGSNDGTGTTPESGDGGGSGGDGDGSGGGDDGGGDGEEETTETEESGSDEFAVTITQGQMPTTLDPQNHRETPTDNVVLHVYEGLLSRDREGRITEGLATGYERQESGRARFQIREGVSFHNGDTLTPRDVAYSVNRIVDENVGLASPQSDQLAGVTGASVVDGSRAVDVQSDGLNPVVFALFASYCDVMQRSWVQNREQSEIAQNMNGTGPFQLASFEEDVQVVLERFDDYWQEPAAVSELTFQAAEESSTRVNQLLEGETDVVVNVPPQEIARVRNSDNADLSAVPSTRIIYNAMRFDVEPFSSPQFRRAMNYAIDLDSIIQNVLQTFGDATGQPTLEGFFGHNPDVDPYPADQDRAENLVDQSGHAGAEIALHTPVGRYLKDLEIAQAVASQIDSLSNVSCEVQQRDFGALAGELVDGDITTGPHFYLIGWGNATFDASQTIIPLLTTDGALTSYSNEEVDSLMEEAQNTGNQDQRDATLQEVNQILHDQAPWIYLNRQYSVYGVSSRVEWTARRDERINAYAMEPAN